MRWLLVALGALVVGSALKRPRPAVLQVQAPTPTTGGDPPPVVLNGGMGPYDHWMDWAKQRERRQQQAKDLGLSLEELDRMYMINTLF